MGPLDPAALNIMEAKFGSNTAVRLTCPFLLCRLVDLTSRRQSQSYASTMIAPTWFVSTPPRPSCDIYRLPLIIVSFTGVPRERTSLTSNVVRSLIFVLMQTSMLCFPNTTRFCNPCVMWIPPMAVCLYWANLTRSQAS
jgi:hypothetical protein